MSEVRRAAIGVAAVLLVGCYEDDVPCTAPDVEARFINFTLPSDELTFVGSGRSFEQALQDPMARVTCPAASPAKEAEEFCYSGPNADFDFDFACTERSFYVRGAVQVQLRVPDNTVDGIELRLDGRRCPCDAYAELYLAEPPDDVQSASAQEILQDGSLCRPGNTRTTLYEGEPCK